MPIAGANPSLDTREGYDKITITEKVTTPYFSNGNTEMLGANVISGSVTDANEKYYFSLAHSDTATTPEFHVTYGNVNGKGGDSNSDEIKSPTEVIYKQWASLLLSPNEVTGGFYISRNNSLSTAPSSAAISAGRDTEIFVLQGVRSNMKDRINKKNWSIILSGSTAADANTGNGILHLTDDSSNDSPVSTPVGDRYNVVSGSDGTIASAATVKTYGFFYPDIGTMVLSQQELSASIPGNAHGKDVAVKFDSGSQKGFVTTTNEDSNYKNGLRFINCLQPLGSKLKYRDEEDQVSNQYFCRIRAGAMNFSNNATFVSGSQNEIRHTSMKGNPTTFITQVQLYNAAGDLVAVGNLSTPLKKNFGSEATIKVKLTY